MKTALFIAGGLVVGLGLGFLFGYQNGYAERGSEQRRKTYEELLVELRHKELLIIRDFVGVSTRITTVDEGGLFSVKKVNYITGTIENRALATSVKDVKLRVDYLSKTNSVISSQEVIIYDIVGPQQSREFRERIELPAKTENYEFMVTNLIPQ